MATDSAVAWRIEPGAADINGNGILGETIRTGAFNLERGVPVVLAAGSPRQEVAGSLVGLHRDLARTARGTTIVLVRHGPRTVTNFS